MLTDVVKCLYPWIIWLLNKPARPFAGKVDSVFKISILLTQNTHFLDNFSPLVSAMLMAKKVFWLELNSRPDYENAEEKVRNRITYKSGNIRFDI